MVFDTELASARQSESRILIHITIQFIELLMLYRNGRSMLYPDS